MTSAIPALTYERIEFGANVLLFVPLGALLASILASRRYLVVPLAVVATVTIEGLQGLLLGGRTSSMLDIVANVTGACAGLVITTAMDAYRARQAPSER